MSTSQRAEVVNEAAAQSTRPVAVSFEFFPPNDAAMEQTLWRSVQRLAPLRPRFVSVTYGADGSTRARTHNVVTRILRETPLTGAPHLTCIGAAAGRSSTSRATTGQVASATSSRCAAIRRRARPRIGRIPAASPMRRTWCAA